MKLAGEIKRHEEHSNPEDVLLTRAPRLRQDRRVGVHKKPSTLTSKVLGSGDVLLSHGLSPYYHRGCSVSLPCSEWERVVPLRYCHQNSAPDFSAENSGELKISNCRLPIVCLQDRHSTFQRTSGSLASTYRFSETSPLRTADATTSEF